MSTEYFANYEQCEQCGLPPEPLRIGTSAGGWCFSLMVYPSKGLDNWENWKAYLKIYSIEDEYGKRIPFDEFVSIVEDRAKSEPWRFTPIYGAPGPNNLMRNNPTNEWFLGHGEGTWDYIRGE